MSETTELERRADGISWSEGAMRLSVTTRDAEGTSRFFEGQNTLRTISFDDGGSFQELWTAKRDDLLADARASIDRFGIFPEAGQILFRIVTLIPGYIDRIDGTKPGQAGWADALEADAPGMHTSDTLDFLVILRGSVDLELDHGAVRHLKVGDCVVQRATRHRWIPRGEEPVVMACVMLGVERT